MPLGDRPTGDPAHVRSGGDAPARGRARRGSSATPGCNALLRTMKRAWDESAMRPEIDLSAARPRDSCGWRIAPGPLLARSGVLPALRVVVGGTQVVVSLHGLAIVLGVGAGALLAVRRAREPAVVAVAAAAVAAASLAGGHALFALVHGGGAGG